MTELPIATSSSASAPSVRALPGAAPARGDTPDAGANPFQDALTQEMSLALAGLPLPGLHVLGSLTKIGSASDSGDDATQAGATCLPMDALLPGLPWSPPTQIITDTGKSTELAGDAPALATATTRTKGIAALPLNAPAEPEAADFAASGKFSAATVGEKALQAAGRDSAPALRTATPAGGHPLPGTSGAANETKADAAARNAELPAHVAASAQDLAATGKLSAQAQGEIGREAAFAARLLEQQHKAAPGAAPAHAQTGAPATQLAAATSAQPVQAPVAAIDARVGANGWDQGLGDKLTWMAANKHQVAELHLNPPDLGPLKVTLTLHHEHASAQFVSAHSQVRDAIETAMPRLREMLADSGITLGDTSVAAENFREQPQQHAHGYSNAPGATPADAGAVSRGESLLRSARGMVDTFV